MAKSNIKDFSVIAKEATGQTPGFIDHVNGIVIELSDETDRGAALYGANILDQVLQDILEAFLVDGAESKKLFNYPAPLSSFSARQNMCLALGLISKDEYNECNVIRKIRNEFAHNSKSELNFEKDEIIDMCRHSSLRKNKEISVNYENMNARGIFTIVVGGLHFFWQKRVLWAKQTKRSVMGNNK